MSDRDVHDLDLECALLDPASSFNAPQGVEAYEARELAVAEEEGMGGGGTRNNLDAVAAALNSLVGTVDGEEDHMAQNNLELMRTLDDAWNAQDWETFEKRHSRGTAVFWPGQTESDKRTRQSQGSRAQQIVTPRRYPERKFDGTPRQIAEIFFIMTTYDGDEDIFQCLSQGAKGHLLKDAPRQEILSAIRAVSEDRPYTSSSVAAKARQRMAKPSLTRRELDVLQLVAQGRSNKDIARRLAITEGTAKTHVKAILTKLDAISRTEAVAVAHKRGMIRL